MADLKQTTDNSQQPIPPPRHPQPSQSTLGAYTPDDNKLNGLASSQSPSPSLSKHPSSSNTRQTAKHFFSAYAQTWLGLSPLWLMGEALLPNKKVGSQFTKGRKNLMSAAEEVRDMVATSGKDVIVIIDEKLKDVGISGGTKGEVAERTAEVIKAAGENAILVVTTSFEKLSAQLSSKDKAKDKAKGTFDIHKLVHDPALKQKLHKHGRDGLVLLDNALKHPVVITGVSRFAHSRGIPYADALLRLASLGLNKILRAIPEPIIPEETKQDIQQNVEAHIEEIEEIDAEELERSSTMQDREEAESIGRVAEKAPTPPIQDQGQAAAGPSKEGEDSAQDPYAKMKKRNDCIVM